MTNEKIEELINQLKRLHHMQEQRETLTKRKANIRVFDLHGLTDEVLPLSLQETAELYDLIKKNLTRRVEVLQIELKSLGVRIDAD